ncbi:hypothetical protein SDC9_19601 [bioreactor metagenome]|uniref:Uncharacterized protein n=1 Tax=bioreactor metagenome TaxID=1076179 RepID=A0A644U4E7_9ZZZZ
MGRVDVAVDVGLDQPVHRDHAETADEFGVVRDLLRAQDQLGAIMIGARVQVMGALGAEREGGGRGHAQLARVDHVEHAVLDHLGEGGHRLEGGIDQARHHRVRHVADARLQRQERLRQAALPHLMGEELEDVVGDRLGRAVGLREGGVAVGGIGLDDRHDLRVVDVEMRLADALIGRDQRDRHAMRRQAGAVIDVVHPLERFRLPAVHLEDDLVGAIEPGLVVADRGGGDQLAAGRDARDLDHGEVEIAVKPFPDHRRDLAQVHVDVIHLAAVDALAQDRVGVVGQAELDAVGTGQRTVKLRAGRGAGEHAHAERAALGMFGLGAGRERHRHRLRIARAGEARHADRGAMRDQRGRILGAHHPSGKAGVAQSGVRLAGGHLAPPKPLRAQQRSYIFRHAHETIRKQNAAHLSMA